MISRYDISTVSEIWTEEARWTRVFRVEMALLETLEENGRIPPGCTDAFQNAKIDPVRIREIEQQTRHDVVAFCSSITEQVDPNYSRFFHYGVTSSDILDTALSLQIRDSLALVAESTRTVIAALESIIQKTSSLLALGRSHGIAAEPMIFAQKFFSFQVEFLRRLEDLEDLMSREITGQFSGAVGNYSILSPDIEARALSKIGLRPEPVSSQVIPRDHIAKIISIGALFACAIERTAVEIRHLSRSEVGELFEDFSKTQTGSSTMPHKKNPISSENLCGIARILRSHVGAAHENTLLWHERDISHSSAERLMLPDHFGLLVYALRRLASLLQTLGVDEERVEQNLWSSHGVLSSILLHSLVEQNSCSRETLYSLVQRAAFESRTPDEMRARVKSLAEGQHLRADLVDVSRDSIRAHYSNRFLEVRRRLGGLEP